MDTDEKSLRRWRDTHAPAADGQQDEELAKYRQKRPEEQAKCELPFLAVPAAGNDDVSEPNTCDHQEEAGESSGDRAETTRLWTGPEAAGFAKLHALPMTLAARARGDKAAV